MLQARPTEVRVHEHRATKVRIVKDRTLQIGTLEVGSIQAGKRLGLISLALQQGPMASGSQRMLDLALATAMLSI